MKCHRKEACKASPTLHSITVTPLGDSKHNSQHIDFYIFHMNLTGKRNLRATETENKHYHYKNSMFWSIMTRNK